MSHLSLLRRAATNRRTGSNRGARRASSLAALAAVAMLVTGCGYVHVHFGSAASGPAGPTVFRADLAFAHCMQAHGLPHFPDPRPAQRFTISGQLTSNPNSPVGRADEACKHLLPGGGTTPRATADTRP